MPTPEEIIANLKDQALAKILEAMAPFIDVRTETQIVPIKFLNNTPQSINMKFRFEQGLFIVEFVPRVRVPAEDVLVVAPNGGERTVEPR